jgi:hypothetical protein
MQSSETTTIVEPVTTLVVTWQNPETRTYYRIGLLKHDLPKDVYTFEYVAGIESVEDFSPLVGLEKIDTVHVSAHLFPVFAERIMDRRRPSFDEWLRDLHAEPFASPMEILARSNGKRGSDTLQLFAMPMDSGDGVSRDKFFVHGIRHLDGAEARIENIYPGEILDVVDDPANRVDQRALIVAANGEGLGWVPGPLLGYVHSIRQTKDWACVALEVNSESAGLHQRLLVEVRGSILPDVDYTKMFLDSPSI